MLDNSSQSPIVSGLKFSTAGGPKFLIIIIAVIIAAAAAGFWYFGGRIPLADKGKDKEEKGAAVEVEVKDGLGAEAFEKSNNPLSEELPETNPFNVNTNPFK